jgi:hypothetical protein
VRTKNIINSIMVLLAILFLANLSPVQAQAGAASELIAQVNAYRAANGLEHMP